MNIKNKYLKERGPASLSDNLRYINDTVSHMEINRFNGVNDKAGYQVVCKAKTINVVTGKKSWVIWAVEEGYEDLEIIIQKAKDQLKNRIVLGFPVMQESIEQDKSEEIEFPVQGRVYNDPNWI